MKGITPSHRLKAGVFNKKMETEINEPKINTKLDKIIAIELLWVQLFDGWKCEKCGIIQGEPRKGFNKYYCEHLPRLDRKLNPIRKRLAQEIVVDVRQKLNQGEGK